MRLAYNISRFVKRPQKDRMSREMERALEQKRADARERVRAAQEREAG